jgi:hypothetical protein
MSIDQTDKIDFLVRDRGKRRAVLVISDHLPWDEDEGEHLLLLQEKLNAYLAFIEGGQILREKPDVRGLPVVIQVKAKYPLSKQATKFYQLAEKTISQAGFSLEFELLHDKKDNAEG